MFFTVHAEPYTRQQILVPFKTWQKAARNWKNMNGNRKLEAQKRGKSS